MKYRVFATEQEAIEAEALVAQQIGCVKVGVNAKNGLPQPDKQVTERWAVLQQIQDGRWIFPSPDDEGVEPGDDWFSVNDEYV